MDNEVLCQVADALHDKVAAAPWTFFHLSADLWTKDLALLAWRQVRFLLAKQRPGFCPETFFLPGRWTSFLALLCEDDVVPLLLSFTIAGDWQAFVDAIDARLETTQRTLCCEPLPEL